MNRLERETSPYLRQHRDNPVDWYPWGEEAFARARSEDRPVMLSVGYSSCHWCHVMAHESFEDDATASLLNEGFVSVKVDREERPDVDAVYMEAVQSMTGQGGWPMTVFLTPDGRPFFGGTYFPKDAKGGLPAFSEVLRAVKDAWRLRREEVGRQADELTAAVRARTRPPPPEGDDAPSSLELTRRAARQLTASYDDVWGGFGRAPKFPQTPVLEMLLSYAVRQGEDSELAMVTDTLDAMASGGIYDHLGGGFSRYSVDERWLVPHFEKMLYDQAGLVRVYLHSWQLTGSPVHRQVLDETIEYVLRDLRARDGGYCSAEDADSEGHEGRFYVWTAAEVEAELGEDLAEVATAWYGITDPGPFEGSNVLHRPLRGDLLRPPDVEAARHRLFGARARRVRPALDDKVLTEWNAMWCSALAEAAGATGRDDWRREASSIGEFLLRFLRRDDGRWLRSRQGGRSRHLAVATDYAWLVDAFTRLGELTGEAAWITEARSAADEMLRLFADAEEGGLFTTGHDAEQLIARAKDSFDGSTPSANSVAAVSLARLGTLVGDPRYLEVARGILALVAAPMRRQPTAFAHALGAAPLLEGGGQEVVVVGQRPDLVAAVQQAYLPDGVLAWGQPYDSPLWSKKEPGRAYVCKSYSCQAPSNDVASLVAGLAQAPPSP